MTWGPAYRLVTSRLELRCPDPARASEMREAIIESLDRLRPFMPWSASEPESVEDKARLVAGWRASFDRGTDVSYQVFDRENDRFLGMIGSHPRCGPGGREIGYWIRTSHEGRGLVTEAAAAVTRAGLSEPERWRMEIHHSTDNTRSEVIPQRLGYTREGILRARERQADGRLSDSVVWSLLREELAGSPVMDFEVEAYDVLGRELELAGAQSAAS
ncbi:MAG: GNAT family protein [Acidobacteriota bacterium]